MIQQKDGLAIHQYYMDIINCMPNIVYWMDLNCMLMGCNVNFVNLLGLKQIKDFNGTPYEQMRNHLPWAEARVEALKLDDLAVLFSGAAVYDREEPPFVSEEGESIYYRSTRVPLFDKDKHVMGLVVILTDITDQMTRPNQLPQMESEGRPSEHSTLEKRLRILIVEDNPVAQSVEKALLAALNCNVDIAESGTTATILFSPGKYDLVFMDIGLQDTSGYIVSKSFREMEKNTRYHVPIIALTCYQADVVKSDCRDYFMDGVMTKPLTRPQAIQLINHYVYHEAVELEELAVT